jgi:Tol biopolymer transport system component
MYCPLCRIPAFRRLRARLARIFALGVLALLVHGCDQPTAPVDDALDQAAPTNLAPSALVSPVSSKIAFLSYTNEESDIYTINPGGGGLTRLTSWSGSEWEPTWSWDHKQLAFVRTRVGSDNVEHADIFLMNGDGSNKRWARTALPYFEMFEPSWSPDGKRLVMTTRLGNSSADIYLATMELGSDTVRYVAPKGKLRIYGRQASWDPTGTSIIYLDYLGTSVHQLVPGGTDVVLVSGYWGIRDAVLSPDGKRLAFTRLVSSDNPEIFVRDLVAKTTKRLTTNAAQDYNVTWSPDGTRLAFLSTRSGQYQVWSMSAATGGGLTQVTHVEDADAPVWAH